MTPEGKVENELKKRVKARHGQTRKVRWLCRRGGPDRLVWWSGPRAAFVEVKRPGEDVDWSSLQGREILRLRKDGWKVYIVNGIEQIDAVLDEIMGVDHG